MICRKVLPPLAIAVLAIAGPTPPVARADDDVEMTFDPVADEPSETDPAPTIEMEPEPSTESEPSDDLDPTLTLDEDSGGQVPSTQPLSPGEPKAAQGPRVSWNDIVVVVRKPFLKISRAEFMPTWGVTMNDNLIQHLSFGGQINYFLTDVLAVGVEGQYYLKNLREPYDLVARQARRLPTLNRYRYSGALNFHYVPVYGKFAVFDKHIVHWETFFTAGIGVTASQVLPRDPRFASFNNLLVTPNVGAAMRFFLTKWITAHIGIRDYVFVDKFEPKNRDMAPTADQAKSQGDTAFVNNVMFQAGLSLWFPTSFRYTTFR